MSLNNFYFIILFGILLLGYWVIGRKQWQKRYLLLWSLGMIAASDLRFLVCVLFVTLICYIIPIAYVKKLFGISKGWVYFGVIVNLLFLGVFKYFNFFYEQICGLLGMKSVVFELILPLGVPFYTFSAISYILDVYHEKILPNRSLTEIALYISFFPKLLSGPIVRANDFFAQLNTLGNDRLRNLECGLQIFVYGCFKKMVLADHLGVFVDQVFLAPKAYHWMTVLWAVFSYSLQIYLDFSGYSDMAIGISKILGFEFHWNFNFPYLSKNLTEFWKRWHISLSSWLQEYLYYSLGGNRKGKARTYCNLILTMLLGGLWHGSSWTFIIWGLLHGCGLVVHKIFRNWKLHHGKRGFFDSNGWNVCACCLTFCYVAFCWIWFRAADFQNAREIMEQIVLLKKGIQQPYTWSMIAAAILIGTTIAAKKYNKCEIKMPKTVKERYLLLDLNRVKGLTLFFVLCGLTVVLAYYGNTVFIYGAF